MSSRSIPSTPISPPTPHEREQSVPSGPVRQILIALAAFVVIVGIGFGFAVVTGATVVINVLVFALFTVLWIAFASALAFSRQTLDGIWSYTRQLPVILQGLVWLLFLPIMIGLCIWESRWSLAVRLVLVLGIGMCNVYIFIPHSL